MIIIRGVYINMGNKNKEIWKVIKEAPFYMVSNEGRIKSCERDVYT